MGAVANVTFTPVTDLANSCGDLRFGFTDVGNAQAESFYPGIGAGGDVWFSYTERTHSFAEGSYNYLTLIHEIGHALGLKHPFEWTRSNPAVLRASLDSESYTVMSYSAQSGDIGTDFTFRPTTPMVLDIRAIQYLYGANMSYNAANTVYQFSQGANYHPAVGTRSATTAWMDASSTFGRAPARRWATWFMWSTSTAIIEARSAMCGSPTAP